MILGMSARKILLYKEPENTLKLPKGVHLLLLFFVCFFVFLCMLGSESPKRYRMLYIYVGYFLFYAYVR